MAAKTRPAEVSLVTAAMELRLSYHQALRRVLIGELSGRKDGRSWLITRESVERLAKAQASE